LWLKRGREEFRHEITTFNAEIHRENRFIVASELHKKSRRVEVAVWGDDVTLIWRYEIFSEFEGGEIGILMKKERRTWGELQVE
jgi:hypothetical protein